MSLKQQRSIQTNTEKYTSLSKNTFCRLLVSHRDDCASFENVKTLVIVRYHQPRPIFTTTDEETGRRGRISISSGWRHQTPAHCRVTVQHAGLDQKDNASKQKTQEQTRHSHADTRDALRVLCWDNKVFNKKKGGVGYVTGRLEDIHELFTERKLCQCCAQPGFMWSYLRTMTTTQHVTSTEDLSCSNPTVHYQHPQRHSRERKLTVYVGISWNVKGPAGRTGHTHRLQQAHKLQTCSNTDAGLYTRRATNTATVALQHRSAGIAADSLTFVD